MICPECGTEIDNPRAFCPFCGAPLEEREPRRRSRWEAVPPCLLAAAIAAGALWWVWCMRG